MKKDLAGVWKFIFFYNQITNSEENKEPKDQNLFICYKKEYNFLGVYCLLLLSHFSAPTKSSPSAPETATDLSSY